MSVRVDKLAPDLVMADLQQFKINYDALQMGDMLGRGGECVCRVVYVIIVVVSTVWLSLQLHIICCLLMRLPLLLLFRFR